ncbi:MAG: hypothetical protein JAY90_15145 [Candidatus Thiodiazotropha lotti]|nr:hypothetical protein [Candidatus Thiodiazotropha lotti]
MKSKIIIYLLVIYSSQTFANFASIRFEAHDTNYALGQWSENDEWALEAQYSFRYNFFSCDLFNRPAILGCKDENKTDIELFFKYTGKFDFYLDSRDSGPIINRLSNPALHLRWIYKDKNRSINMFDLGLEHRSNGQTVDADELDLNPNSPTYGQHIAEIEHQNNNHQYFDTISRGADYLSLTLGGVVWKNLEYELSTKLYFNSEESQVTWGKLAGNKTSFKDYDTINLKLTKELSKTLKTEIDYKVGLSGLATDSADIYLMYRWSSKTEGWNIPIFFKAHFGPMERLSDYTNSITSYGLGILFYH